MTRRLNLPVGDEAVFNQLALARYPEYVGLDVSASAVARCAERFASDATKASSGSTFSATDIGSGTTLGEEEAAIVAPPSNSQVCPRLYF